LLPTSGLTTVTVHDLNAAQEPAGVVLASPLTSFLTFAGKPWTVTLTEVFLGTDGTAGCQSIAVGDRCTIPNSPFNLENKSGGQVAVDFEFLGTANDGSGNISNVAGNFGTSFSNTTIKGIIDAITSGGTVVTSGHATLGFTAVSSTPEPGSTSLVLLGIALLGGGLARRRREMGR
jgi:MYXO-CTERM domain-containing protein